jgi:hypothetical protein
MLNGGVTFNVRFWVAVCAVGLVPSVALTVKFHLPPLVGVPDMVPPALRDRPEGRLPEESVHV